MKANSRLILSVLASLLLHGLLLLHGDGVFTEGGGKLRVAMPLQVVQLGARPEPMPELVSVAAVSAVTLSEGESQVEERRRTTTRQGKESRLPLPLPPIHFYTRAELNRFPVLLNPLPANSDVFAEFGLSASGRAVLIVFIGKDGLVSDVDVEAEATSLPPAIVEKARQLMRNAKFTPGYLYGDPVPSQVRWEFILRPSGIQGVQIRNEEVR